jgi:hypothetical protein
MDQNEVPHDTRHLDVPSGASKMISEPMVCLVQTVQLSCVKICTISKWIETASTLALSPRSTIGCIQNDLWAYDMLVQTVHLTCTDSNTVFKRTQTSFHFSLVTLKYHRVRPKWFLSLWCVCCNPCTYLASTQTLSKNEPNRASTW